MIYIPYFYTNANDKPNLNAEYQQLKNKLLTNQLIEFNTDRIENMVIRPNSMSDKNIDEAISWLKDVGTSGGVVGQKLAESLSQVVEGITLTTSASASGLQMNGKTMSYQGIANIQYKEKDNDGNPADNSKYYQLLEELGKNLSSVIAAATKAMDDMGKMIEKHYSDYWKACVLRGKEIDADDDAAFIVKQAFAKRGTLLEFTPEMLEGKSVDADAQALCQDYLSIKAKIQALTVLKNGQISASEDKNSNEIVRQLIGKIGGTFSDASGHFFEIIVQMAADQAMSNKEVAETLVNMFGKSNKTALAIVSGTTGISTETVAKIDDRLKKIAESSGQKGFQFSKNDVTVAYSGDKATLMYGISVKYSNAIKRGGVKKATLKLQQATPFFQLIQKYVISNDIYSLQDVYTLAAARSSAEEGHPWNSSKSGKEYLASHKTGEQQLVDMWRSMVDDVIVANFLDALAGDGSFGNNNLFMSVNDALYPIGAVLAAVAKNPDMIEAVSKGGGGTKNRYNFYRENLWIPNKSGNNQFEAAKIRSTVTQAALYKKMSEAKVTIKLNSALLNGLQI